MPARRLATGLGDPERERKLLQALNASGDVVVVERCLSADQLLACAQLGHIDAVLAATDLHRLSDTRLEELARTRLPLVLLVPDADEERWRSFPAALLPLDAEAGAVHQALLAVMRGERPRPASRGSEVDTQPAEPASTVEALEAALSLMAVASGRGSPGRTTVALNLATALGAVAPTILVDADLVGPSVAACLDADPTRNLSMLVHAEPETPREWDRTIAQEVQPLHPRSPHAAVLCGVPKPEMRATIPIRFFERLIIELRQRYRYVILDLGADLLGAEAALHRAGLAAAQQILLVASPDLVGLWHARTALGLLHRHLDLGSDRVALVINRHDPRYHHGRTEIEWALGVPTAALIPYDHSHIQRALAAQRPVALDERSRAGRALTDLAERIHGSRILLPPEVEVPKTRRWLSQLWMDGIRRRRPRPADGQGVTDGDFAAPIS